MKTIILEYLLSICAFGFFAVWLKIMVDMTIDIYKTAKYSTRYKEMKQVFIILEGATYKPNMLSIDYEGGPSMGDNETILAINVSNEHLNQTCRFQATKEQVSQIIEQLQKLVDKYARAGLY